jgi:hypothetical protein
MPDSRTTAHVGEYVKPRFRCLVCAVFVIGTERGVCPRCGYAPPVQPKDDSGPVDLRAWKRVQDGLEPPVHRYARTPFLVALAFAVVVAVVATAIGVPSP